MNAINRHQLIDQLNWRYATKQFDPAKKISAQDWAALEQVMVLSPSSLGLQPWNFIVIDDTTVRARLLLASFGQPQVVDASHLVVFATKSNFGQADIDAHIQHIADVRGVSLESLAPFKTMAERRLIQGMDQAGRQAWAVNQTYIALGNLTTSAAVLGIDATPMEGFERHRYDDILGLPVRGLTASVIAALGYRKDSDKYATAPKVRFPREEIVQHV